ncbi:type II secretion system F family protein [Thermodesulfovibrionales bacterium]|nr:type II secretion system F family protein [Thermodesulfovibrionales bacterium]
MATYNYKGYDTKGKEVTGVIESISRAGVVKALKDRKIQPFLIADADKKREKQPFYANFRKKETGPLFFQLGIMIKSGLPLAKALQIATKEHHQRWLSPILAEIHDDISGGMKLSDSLKKFPNIFSETHVNMIHIAEMTGRLADVLLNIGQYEDKRQKSERKLKNALTYPAVITLIGSGVVGFLLGYVVPKMEGIFETARIEVPLSTLILINTGAFLRDYGLFVVILLSMLSLYIVRLYKSKTKTGLRMKIDNVMIKISLLQKAAMSSFLEHFAFQLKEGIPMVLALHSCTGVIKNLILRNEIKAIVGKIEQGISLSGALRDSILFDEMLRSAVITGESSGTLADYLEKMSEYYRKDVDRAMGRLTSLAEPVFILLLGLVVGFIVISIMLPLFEMNRLVR